MGVIGLFIGTVISQVCGAAAYRRVLATLAQRPARSVLAGVAAGIVTALVATPLFILFGVHTWLAGPASGWPPSAFMGACMGLCQGALFKGLPQIRRPVRRL
jgi:hypothetical protein